MGTDIHIFIEIDYSQEGKIFEFGNQIYAFNSGELIIPRNYDLFNALGDGRNYHFDYFGLIIRKISFVYRI